MFPNFTQCLKIQVISFRHMKHWFRGTQVKCNFTSAHPSHTLRAELILGRENREKCIAKLKKMKPIRVSDTVPMKKAAVFVPLCVKDGEVSLLYTLRSADLKNYRGQVSFPGGVKDSTDGSLEETAVRETYEELGIRKYNIDMWGHGCYVGTGRQEMAVLPFIGCIGNVDIKNLKINPTEVESVFTVSLKHLCDSSNLRYTQFRNSYTLPVFIGGEQRIWGMTAIITHILLTALLPDVYRNQMKTSHL